jgi:uncharacterized SAM-binding protein YcdF (DUF218 family)
LGWLALGQLGVPQIAGLGESALLWLAALVGAALALTRLHGPLRWASMLLGALLVVVTATPAVRPLARGLVRRDAPAAGGARPDAVVALSSGMTGEGLVAGDGIERLLSALELAKASGAPLVVTVTRPAPGRGPTTEADQRRLAALAGVPVLTVDPVFSTRDEAVQVAALARARGWRRVAVVTSPLHTRRACATFERAGLAVACAPSASRDVSLATLRGAAERLRAFRLVLYEAAAGALYRARGWI